MRPWAHLLASLILSTLFYTTFKWGVLFILFGGVLIDIDHYFWYILKYKKFNVLTCYRFFAYEAPKDSYREVNGLLLVFHTVEFFLIMAALSFYYNLALMFAIGLFFHYFLDGIWYYIVAKRVIANHSIIYLIAKQIQKV